MILTFSGCEGSRRVGGTYQHGNVPSTNYNKTDSGVVTNINPPVIEEIANPTNISFWTLYIPFLVIVLYIAYKTFKSDKINN